MKITIAFQVEKYQLNLSPIHISIPLKFNDLQPNSYGVPNAKSHAFEGGGFVGDVRRGGSCNFEVYQFIPHCNGTHTECVGHLTADRISVHSQLNDIFIPATLISVMPVFAKETTDTYNPHFNDDDKVLDKKSLEQVIKNYNKDFLKAIIIRTLPNDITKCHRDYTKEDAPFFSIEAMQYLRELGVEHLLIDTPSVDRLLDEGKLSAHNIFFDTKNIQAQNNLYTITEFIYVPDNVLDGKYMLNLQIAPFVSDAAPSRPILMEISS